MFYSSLFGVPMWCKILAGLFYMVAWLAVQIVEETSPVVAS